MSDRPSAKLRNCPCCGSAAYWQSRVTKHFLFATTTVEDLWRASCGVCDMQTAWSGSPDFIALTWNRLYGGDLPPPSAIDMLEALKAVVRVADRDTVEFDLARAAIKKAEGLAAGGEQVRSEA